jgi:cobalt-zinc-cadmium resistance protein CzcA
MDEPEKDTTGYREFVHATELENRLIELDNLFIRVHYYKSYALGRAEALINIARAKLQSEEIDYIEYSTFISEAYKIRLDYLDILNRYNQSAIQLEHYAY